MSVPNQKIITINPDGDFNKERLYAKIHLDTFQQAMKNLKSSDFKLWCYLVKNNPGYTFELSCAAAQKWGIGKTAYYEAVQGLIEKGYLKQRDANSNLYDFFPQSQKDKKETPKEEEVKEEKIDITKQLQELGGFNF